MIIAILPAAVCIVGILIWALSGHAVVKEAGRIMFAFGLLVTLFVMAAERIRIP